MRKKSIVRRRSQTQALVNYVNRHGLRRAGIKYDCSAATLMRWLHKEGYQAFSEWRKVEVENETTIHN